MYRNMMLINKFKKKNDSIKTCYINKVKIFSNLRVFEIII